MAITRRKQAHPIGGRAGCAFAEEEGSWTDLCYCENGKCQSTAFTPSRKRSHTETVMVITNLNFFLRIFPFRKSYKIVIQSGLEKVQLAKTKTVGFRPLAPRAQLGLPL